MPSTASYIMIMAFALLAVRDGLGQPDRCVFNDNECQCSQRQSGSICLRYSSGTEDTKCVTYECGTGYVCDCTSNPIQFLNSLFVWSIRHRHAKSD